MRRAVLIALTMLLAACGPETVNDASASREANRIAWDLQGNWSLAIEGPCSGGEGVLQVASTLAWRDERTLVAGATGTGDWGCGVESGSFALDVTTTGVVELTLYRTGQPAGAAWSGVGIYTPRSMAGRLDGENAPWSARHQ